MRIGHIRRDAIFARDILLRININLHKLQLSRLRLLLCEAREDGRNGFTRAAPIGVKVDDRVG